MATIDEVIANFEGFVQMERDVQVSIYDCHTILRALKYYQRALKYLRDSEAPVMPPDHPGHVALTTQETK